MRPSAVTTTELLSGGPPRPSISTAPRNALPCPLPAGPHPARHSSAQTMARLPMNHHHSRTYFEGMEYNRPAMSPETLQVPEPASAGMGTFSRITGVFFEPGKTFEDIGRRPSWLVP